MKLSRRQFAAAGVAAVLSPAAALAQRLPAATVRDVPWLGEVQTPPAALPTDVPPLFPLLVDAGKKPITTLPHWLEHRKYLDQQWREMVGVIRSREYLVEKAKRPPTYEVRESDRTAGVSRRLIRYEAERGVPVEAYLLAPLEVKAKVPGVVVFHSTVDYTIRQGAGLEGPAAAHWGLKLAQRGLVALCPRNFLWTNERKDFKARVTEHQRRHGSPSRGMAKMLFDAQRAVDLLCSLEEVDASRIGACGHSLGAKEVLYLAALDPRIKAAVSSEGGVGTTFSNWDAPWYWGSKEFFGQEHHQLLALAAPRAFLLIGGNSADGDRSWPFIEQALGVYRLYGEPCRLGFYNHRQGHSIPPLAEQRTYEWLQAYL